MRIYSLKIKLSRYHFIFSSSFFNSIVFKGSFEITKKLKRIFKKILQKFSSSEFLSLFFFQKKKKNHIINKRVDIKPITNKNISTTNHIYPNKRTKVLTLLYNYENINRIENSLLFRSKNYYIDQKLNGVCLRHCFKVILISKKKKKLCV